MKLRKGYTVPATVVPGHHTFPVVDSNDVAGGYQYFNTLSDANAIPLALRKKGMEVYIESEETKYRLIDNKDVLDDNCWQKENTNSGSGSSTTPQPSVQIESQEFTVNQNQLPFVAEWEVPTTGPIMLQVSKEVEETVQTPGTEEVNPVTFSSNNANLFTIKGTDDGTSLVTVDDNGIRMKDNYVDTAMDLQMFGNPLPAPVPNTTVGMKHQLIIADCKFTFDNLNEFEGVSVEGSIGSNNFVGLVIRENVNSESDFGNGIGYDFEENKWFVGFSDYYNMASWPGTLNLTFNTDFDSTIADYYVHNQTQYDIDTYVIASIPIRKVKDIPAAKWQELFTPNGTVEISSRSFEGHGVTTIPALDKSKAQICFIFATMDETQPCRVTKLTMKKSATITNTTIKKVPAITPDDFTYDLSTKTGKTAVRFEWSGWQVDMTGKLYCENWYFPVTSQ